MKLIRLRSQHLNVGAVSTFIGYVRGLNNQKKVTSINLEVYKDMAIQVSSKIFVQ